MTEGVNFFEYRVFPKNKEKKCVQLREDTLTSENHPEVFSLAEKYHLNLPKISILHSVTPQAYAWPSLSVTKGLINILNEKELFATILHEIGHRKTGWRFFDYIFIPLYFSGLFYLTILLLKDFTLLNFLGLLFFRGLLSVLLCAVQRKIEFVADSYAAEILLENREWLGEAIKKTCELIKRDLPIFDRLLNYFAFWPFRTHPLVEERLKSISQST